MSEMPFDESEWFNLLSGYIRSHFSMNLADYVDSEVPAVAEKVFHRARYPIISISGQGFPIAMVKP